MNLGPDTESQLSLELYAIHSKFYPGVSLNWFQRELIADQVTDTAIWTETLKFWLGNDYRGQSVEKICKKYHDLVEEKRKDARVYVGKETAPTTYIPEPPCGVCGKEYCLTIHREQIAEAYAS